MDTNKALKTINKQTEHLTEKFLKEVEKSVLPPPPEKAFDSIVVLRKKAVDEARLGLKILKENYEQGIEAILELLKTQDPANYRALGAWFVNHTHAIEKLLADEAEFSSTESLADKLKFPRKLLAVMYASVQDLFKQSKYAEAASAILICINFEPKVFDFWFTYGQILQAKRDDVGALYAFQTGLIFDENNPSAYGHMAKSWIALSQPAEALECINLALKFSEGNSGAADFIDYCHGIFNYCKKQLANT